MDCAKFFQFNSFQRGNIIEVGQTVFCWLKPAPLALWRSKAQVHRSHVLSLAALWHHSLLMNGIVMYMYYLLEKKEKKYVSGDRMEGQTVSTVMILSFRTDRSGQTVQTQIRLLISIYTVCHSVCILLWENLFMPCANKKGTDQPPSMHFTLNPTALCYMYICHIPLWIVKMHQSFLLSRPRKKICVLTIAWKN